MTEHEIDTILLLALLPFAALIALTASHVWRCIGPLPRRLRRPACMACGHAITEVSAPCPGCDRSLLECGVSTPWLAHRHRGSAIVAILSLICATAAAAYPWYEVARIIADAWPTPLSLRYETWLTTLAWAPVTIPIILIPWIIIRRMFTVRVTRET